MAVSTGQHTLNPNPKATINYYVCLTAEGNMPATAAYN